MSAGTDEDAGGPARETSTAREVTLTAREWFRRHVPDVHGEIGFERITGGRSNLTYRVTDEAGHAWALRRPPLGGVLETAHDMAREWRFIAALAPTDVPVPTPLAYCDDHDVWGADFYVMDFAPGRVLADPQDGAALGEPARTRAGESTIDVLAALHRVDPEAVGLGDFARPGNFVARQLKRWHRQVHASALEDLRAVDAAHDALAARIPDGATGVAHGDFRPGNIAYDAQGEAVAVFDWELATLGDPMCDLGWLLASWSDPDDDVPAATAGPTQAGGFPSRDDLIARYASVTGRGLSDVGYYIGFARWRAACIHAGVWTRFTAGDMGEDADTSELQGPEAITAQAEAALAAIDS